MAELERAVEKEARQNAQLSELGLSLQSTSQSAEAMQKRLIDQQERGALQSSARIGAWHCRARPAAQAARLSVSHCVCCLRLALRRPSAGVHGLVAIAAVRKPGDASTPLGATN